MKRLPMVARQRVTPAANDRRLRKLAVPIVCGALAAGGASTPATAAPWGFEQVTPPSKGAGTLNSFDTFRPSDDGSRILYTTTAPLDGVATYASPQYVRYLAARTESGWLNRAVDPPFDSSSHDSSLVVATVIASSSNLQYAAVASTRALAPGAVEGGSNLYMREVDTGRMTLIAATSSRQFVSTLTNNQGGLSVKFVAPDGRSAMFLSDVPLTADAAGVAGDVLYSWTAEDGVRSESVLPASEGGATARLFYAGRDSEAGTRDPLPSSNALDHVYFTPLLGGSTGPVYVRTTTNAGVRETQPVSVSEVTGLPVPAQVDAVSDEGRYVLFHAPQLTATVPAGHEGAPRYLYRYDIATDTTTHVGPLNTLQGSDVLQMTRDGQTVAFQTQMAVDGDAVAGRVNTYLWRNGNLQHVATADPGSAATNEATFLRLLSPSGRYFTFTDDSASLAASFGIDNQSAECAPDGSPAGTTGPCSQVYRFDADASGGAGQLECVSCRTDGQRPNGASGEPNNSAPGIMRMDGHQMRTITDDGTVFFTSADDLVSADRNGASDAYAYRNGELVLLSRATLGTRSRFVDASLDGQTAFISTDDAIGPNDNDRAFDLYMTRAGAGFAIEPPIRPAPCRGGDCRGAAPLPGTGVILPGSVLAPGGNVTPEKHETTRATLRSLKLRRTTSLRVSVRTNGAGRIRLSGKGLRTTTRMVNRAGAFRMTVRLNRSAQRRLKRNGRYPVRLRISVAPPFGKTTVRTYRRNVRSSR